MRVLFDTNVLVSALVASGPPGRLIEQVVAGRIELVLAEPVERELERTLQSKLGLTRVSMHSVLESISGLASYRLTAPDEIEAVTEHEADDRILACAVAANVDALVTGDRKHLLPLREHRGIRIVAPQALLAELVSGPR